MFYLVMLYIMRLVQRSESVWTPQHKNLVFWISCGINGAFFIATDPVSASTTPRGRLIFGAAIGFWTVIIRTFGGYPDAIAFSVVIMNMAVPLIDYYTQPKVYGQQRPVKQTEGEP